MNTFKKAVPVFILLISFFIQSCSLSNRLYIESDVVKQSQRYRQEITYTKTEERRSPLILLKQTIIKEKKYNGESNYTIYDVLRMTDNAYMLEDKLYILADAEVIPVNIQYKEQENVNEIKEKTANIATSDSTSVKIVTGYSQHNRKVIRIKYELDEISILKMTSAKKVFFRYYSGPHMITVKVRRSEMRKLRKIHTF